MVGQANAFQPEPVRKLRTTVSRYTAPYLKLNAPIGATCLYKKGHNITFAA